MVIKEIEIAKADNFTAKDAQNIAAFAMRFDSEIYFEWKSRKINAKSIMGVISMTLKSGDKLIIIAKGSDDTKALSEMESYFSKNFKN
jgi:catabolite repression HPr-like protein